MLHPISSAPRAATEDEMPVTDQMPENIACSNCRDMFAREETPFPGEGDFCDECAPCTGDL